MVQTAEPSSQFIDCWIGIMSSSQEQEPMDVQMEVSTLVYIVFDLCIYQMYEPPVVFTLLATLEELQVSSVILEFKW